MPDEIVNLVFRCIVGKALQELSEVLLAVEIVAAFRRVVDVPSCLLQFVKSGKKVRRLPKRRHEALDHLFTRESLYGIDGGGQTGSQQQRSDLGCGFLAGLQINHLRVSRKVAIPE